MLRTLEEAFRRGGAAIGERHVDEFFLPTWTNHGQADELSKGGLIRKREGDMSAWSSKKYWGNMAPLAARRVPTAC